MCDCYFATQLLEPICETKHGTGKVLDFHKNYEENGGRKKEKEKKQEKKGFLFYSRHHPHNVWTYWLLCLAACCHRSRALLLFSSLDSSQHSKLKTKICRPNKLTILESIFLLKRSGMKYSPRLFKKACTDMYSRIHNNGMNIK